MSFLIAQMIYFFHKQLHLLVTDKLNLTPVYIYIDRKFLPNTEVFLPLTITDNGVYPREVLGGFLRTFDLFDLPGYKEQLLRLSLNEERRITLNFCEKSVTSFLPWWVQNTAFYISLFQYFPESETICGSGLGGWGWVGGRVSGVVFWGSEVRFWWSISSIEQQLKAIDGGKKHI